jgi:hypothetical protein
MEDPAYRIIMYKGVKVVSLIGATTPIRIDVRRFNGSSEFPLFDVNMKPVSLYTEHTRRERGRDHRDEGAD